MARPFKHEVAAVNIRISNKAKRDYSRLIKFISELKRPVNVYSNTQLAINYFDKEKNFGVISRYDELDIEGNWFDEDNFDIATAKDLEEINLPSNLKPHLYRFYFSLNPELHTIAFSCYGASTALSLNYVKKYFDVILLSKEVAKEFGTVHADIVKDHAGVRKILNLKELREVEITIRPPNPDDISKSLASVIEKRLAEQNAEEYVEKLKTKGKKRLKLNSRTKALGGLAAENGEVKAKNIENGIVVPYTSADMPLKEVNTFDGDASELSIFYALAKIIFDKIGKRRGFGKKALE